MAINFLNSVGFNQNELLAPTIENQPNDAAAGTPVSGQLYYNTTDKVIKYGKDDGSGTIVWSTIDTDTGITSINATTNGGSLGLSNTLTANGTLTLAWQGNNTQYVDGAGNLTTFPTIPTVPSNIVETVVTTNGTYINLTPTTAASGNVTITADLSAVDGTAAAGERYLTKTNKWATVASIPGTYTFTTESNTGSATVDSGDNLIISGGDYITGAVTKVGTNITNRLDHDSTSRTDTTSTDSPAFGGTFTAVQSVTTNSTGHVTAIDVSTVTLPTPAASDNYQYWVLSDGTNSTNITSTGTATFQGTSGEIGVTESSGTVTIGLRDNVTIPNNLTVTNTIDMTNGQINNLANGTASTDAVNLGQVQGLIAGTGQFQGGYDATNDPGSPVISGASNIALDTGDFYVVTVDGDITFSDQTISVEVGDLIFANTDIAANSNPASTDYTFVIQDQNIAGEGATDSATEKGVAGFNSAFFSVTANGFVSADYATASTAGVNYIAAGTGLTATYGASGRITISKDNTNQSAKRLSLNSAVNGITRAEAGGVTTFTLDVTDSNLFGAGADPLDVMCEVLGNAVNAGDTVYASIERSGSNLLVKFTGSVANGDYQILLNYVA
jgi:hypothetical protein